MGTNDERSGPVRDGAVTAAAQPRRSLAAARLAIGAAVVAFATWAVPALLRWSEPADYTNLVAGGWSLRMTQDPAEVLFLGNSVAQWGVDVALFEQLARRRTDLLWAGASASAWWYLVLDNFVAKAEPRPGLVVLCFSDNLLTLQSLLVGPQALDRIESLLDEEDLRSGAGDRVLESSHNPAFVVLERHWPLVEARGGARRAIEGAVKGYVAALQGRPAAALDESLARVFDVSRKDTAVLADEESPPEEGLDRRLYDFERMKDRSFLPDILEVAETHRLELVFVRMPRRLAPGRQQDGAKQAALREYDAELERYLAQRGFTLLDFSASEGLRAEDFAHGDHLNEAGRAIFTRRLVAALEIFLPSSPPAASPRVAAARVAAAPAGAP